METEAIVKTSYKTNQTRITTTVAFLIGVKEEMFAVYNESPELIQNLKGNSDAIIMRCLCNIRSNLMLNYVSVERSIVYDLKNLDRLEYFKDDVKTLQNYGISIVKVNYKVNSYLADINMLIANRMEKLRELFPEWINWTYIKELFIMPKGNKEKNIKEESCKYSANRDLYPYKRYIYWRPTESGNILISDSKFLKVLYSQHNDYFEDKTKVLDASEEEKTSIYDFIDRNEAVVIVVDCENSDAFKLASALKQLNEDEISKISKIVLYDDVHTTKAWRFIDKITTIPVEHKLIKRIKEDKSLVDMKICADVSAFYYRHNISAFILLSSDSDFWGLISSLPDADFLVMIENLKCGQDIKNALIENGTYYCSLDDFYSGNIKNFKNSMLMVELEERIKDICNIDTKQLLDDIYTSLRLDAEHSEKKYFYDKYIKGLKLHIDADGIMTIKIPM